MTDGINPSNLEESVTRIESPGRRGLGVVVTTALSAGATPQFERETIYAAAAAAGSTINIRSKRRRKRSTETRKIGEAGPRKTSSRRAVWSEWMGRHSSSRSEGGGRVATSRM